jgi:hypothetical protein
MWPLAVVVSHVETEDALEVAAVEDQQPVQALRTDCAHEALGDRVRLRRPYRRLHDPNALAAEDFIERPAALAVPVTDQEPIPFSEKSRARLRVRGSKGLEIARRLRHATQITFTLGNLGLVAVLEERHDDAISLLEEDLRLCNARGDHRVGGEAILGLATAHAALGSFDLAVKLEAIAKALYNDASNQPDPVVDRLEPHLRVAREHADAAIVAAFTREGQALTMDAAIAELERR